MVKIIIGDTLSVHLSPDIIQFIEKYKIDFVFLLNLSHVTRLLGIVFFYPLKRTWKSILDWKSTPWLSKNQPLLIKTCFLPFR